MFDVILLVPCIARNKSVLKRFFVVLKEENVNVAGIEASTVVYSQAIPLGGTVSDASPRKTIIVHLKLGDSGFEANRVGSYVVGVVGSINIDSNDGSNKFVRDISVPGHQVHEPDQVRVVGGIGGNFLFNEGL